MQLNIQKNRIFNDLETGKTVLVKECIHYPGEKRFKVVLSYGFGASEERETVYVKENDTETFLKRFSSKEQKRFEQILKGSIVEKKNNLTGMRAALFNSIYGVVDGTMKLEQAKSIAQTSQVIVNSIKVEIEYKKMIKDTTKSQILE